METFPLLFLLIALGAFMFFASRRQKKAMQATIDLHDSLRGGDRSTPPQVCRPPSGASPMTASTWRSPPASSPAG